jgi:beta-lactam-binding protein with PASTA domain
VKAYGETGRITLTVSLGPVPDVVGKTVDEASAALDDVGLVLGARTEEYSETVPTGQIVSAAVQESPAVRGSAVDVVVSKGPTPITVPKDGVVGKTINEATKTLEDLGLKVSVPDCTNILCGFYDWKSTLPVTGTDPGSGATVYRGDTVTLSYDQ